jgi:hypothetical protein
MCHKIDVVKDYVYPVVMIRDVISDEYCRFFLGFKEISYDEGANDLRTPYLSAPISVTESKFGFVLTTKPSLSRQQIMVSLNPNADSFMLSRDLLVGQHLAPIPTDEKVDLAKIDSEDNANAKRLLVAFLESDVTFFDGVDVSVSQYYVLNPEAPNLRLHCHRTAPYSEQDLLEGLSSTFKLVCSIAQRRA